MKCPKYEHNHFSLVLSLEAIVCAVAIREWGIAEPSIHPSITPSANPGLLWRLSQLDMSRRLLKVQEAFTCTYADTETSAASFWPTLSFPQIVTTDEKEPLTYLSANVHYVHCPYSIINNNNNKYRMSELFTLPLKLSPVYRVKSFLPLRYSS